MHFSVRQFIDSNGAIEIDHPPYSPDLAPCDYWLFDYIKQRLGDENDANSLLRSITKIFNAIPHKEWINAFNKYNESCCWCSD